MDLSVLRKDHMDLCYAACVAFGYALRRRFEVLRSRQAHLEGLSEFDADKTMRLLDKLWEKRRDRAGKPLGHFRVNRHFNDKHGQRIAFPVGVEDHGRGSSGYKPVLEVIRAFDRYSPPSGKILPEIEVDREWGPIKLVVPQVSAGQLALLHKQGILDGTDIGFLERFGEACGSMEEDAAIAVGRHDCAEHTRVEILWELSRWKSWTIDALAAMSQNSGASDIVKAAAYPLWQSWSFALEGKRKVGCPLNDQYGHDRTQYQLGLKGLQTAVAEDHEMRNCVGGAQPAAEAIWENPLVEHLRFCVCSCWWFSNYFVGTIKELNEAKPTILRRRLRSVTQGDVRVAFRKVTRLVQVPAKDRPAKFYVEWLDRDAETLGDGPAVEIAPSNVWDGSVSLSEFVASLEAVAGWLINEHVDRDIACLREEEA